MPTSTPAPALAESRWSFLTAEWRHLCLFTYPVVPARLHPYVPPGLTLDTRDGTAFVSLVAFDFLKTRVLGVPWPGYRTFPEINLRFYVREGERRGVCFIRELVPKRLIAWLARRLYNEPYVYAPMKSRVEHTESVLNVTHDVRLCGKEHSIHVRAASASALETEDSTAHFFKEHTWGYGQSRRGKLLRYEVRHDVWRTHAVRGYELNWDFAACYGDEWADLNETPPCSVVLASGSPVRVSPAY